MHRLGARRAISAFWWVLLGAAGATGGALYGWNYLNASLSDLSGAFGAAAAALAGGVFALPQWLLLWGRVPRAHLWVPITVVAMALGALIAPWAGMVLMLFTLFIPAPGFLLGMVWGGATAGMVVGLAQLYVLPPHARAWTWLLASSVGGATLAFGPGGRELLPRLGGSPSQIPLGGVVSGVIYEVLAGVVLVLLLRSARLPQVQDDGDQSQAAHSVVGPTRVPLAAGVLLTVFGAIGGTTLTISALAYTVGPVSLPLAVSTRFLPAPDHERWINPVWLPTSNEIFILTGPRVSPSLWNRGLSSVRPDGTGLRSIEVPPDPDCPVSVPSELALLPDGRLGVVRTCSAQRREGAKNREPNTLFAYDALTGTFEQLVPYPLPWNTDTFSFQPDMGPALIQRYRHPDAVLWRLAPGGPETI
jgi:hypothetical protein